MQTTREVLARSGSIAASLVSQRIAMGREWVAERFTTSDNPEGFFLRVTERSAMWIVPVWGRYDEFEDAGVSFCRSETPFDVARAAV